MPTSIHNALSNSMPMRDSTPMSTVTKTERTYPYPCLIAHRGAGTLAPENTLSAFRLGAEFGFTMFECDAKLSKDQVLFLHHDDLLDRTTNGRGAAGNFTWQTLSTLDAGCWHSAHFTGEPLMRLRSLIDFCLANEFFLNIEIKPNSGEAYETGHAVATLLQKFTDAFTPINPFLLSSFEPKALRAVCDVDPSLPRALLLDAWHDDAYAFLEQNECSGLITNFEIMTPEIVAHCHQHNRFVMVYTANAPYDIERLLGMGVDSVITDNMSILHEIEIGTNGD